MIMNVMLKPIMCVETAEVDCMQYVNRNDKFECNLETVFMFIEYAKTEWPGI